MLHGCELLEKKSILVASKLDGLNFAQKLQKSKGRINADFGYVRPLNLTNDRNNYGRRSPPYQAKAHRCFLADGRRRSFWKN